MEGLSFAVSLILAVIFISSIFEGRKKGFVRVTLSLISTLISGLIGANYAEPVATYVAQKFVHKPLVESISLSLTNAISDGKHNIAEALPEYVVNAVNNFSPDLLSNLGKSVNTADVAEKIYTAIEGTVIIGILYAIAFIVIYMISSAILGIGISFVDRFFKLPILKGLNKTFGGLIGALKGAIVVAIISVILHAIATAFPETPFAIAVSGSSVQQFIFDTVSNMF